MMAVVLLTVGVFALIAEMGMLTGHQIKATSSSEMTTLGESKLEELRSYAMLESVSKAQVALGGSLTTSEADHFDVIAGPSGRQYTRRWLVEAGPGGTRSVSLRVSAPTAQRHVPMATDFNTLMVVIE
jgi:Tfp pilus assembly protein PilV